MDEPRTTGIAKGGLLLGFAKLWFLLSAYSITIALTRLLPPATYGSYYVVARLVAVPNLVLVYSLLFTVSRPLAAQHGRGFPDYDSLRRRGLRLAVVLGGATMLLFMASAPLFGRIFADRGLVAPIVVVAPISLVYAVYAVNLGTLNAIRRFNLQAAMDIFMSTTKAALIIVAAALGAGLTMTCGGFTAASVLAFGVSTVVVARVRPRTAARSSTVVPHGMATLAMGLLVFTACVNLLQSIDVLLVKRFVADELVGFYSSAQQVALIPLSLMNAVALVVFPHIASLHEGSDVSRTRAYVQGSVKVTLVLLAFMSAVGSASASDVQKLLFPAAYGAAADQLRLLVWGFSGYSFAITTAWIFNGARRGRLALTLVIVPLVVVITSSLLWVPEYGTIAAAWSVLAAGVAATLAALVGLRWTFAMAPDFLVLAKIAAAVMVVEALSALLPSPDPAGIGGKLAILARLAVLAAAFLGVTVATRAVRVSEIRWLRKGQ